MFFGFPKKDDAGKTSVFFTGAPVYLIVPLIVLLLVLFMMFASFFL